MNRVVKLADTLGLTETIRAIPIVEPEAVHTIGLVVPFADDRVPNEGPVMYPHVTFVPHGTGVGSLTPEGYDQAFYKIVVPLSAGETEIVACP